MKFKIRGTKTKKGQAWGEQGRIKKSKNLLRWRIGHLRVEISILDAEHKKLGKTKNRGRTNPRDEGELNKNDWNPKLCFFLGLITLLLPTFSFLANFIPTF